jgi:hypothetical protein
MIVSGLRVCAAAISEAGVGVLRPVCSAAGPRDHVPTHVRAQVQFAGAAIPRTVGECGGR